MKIGFTGTQAGMTDEQALTFASLFRLDVHVRAKLQGEMETPGDKLEFHHGDCIGADSSAHDIVRDITGPGRFDGIPIIVHPPINQSKRAFTIGHSERQPKPYLERNHDIVDECDLLIACPKGFTEELRSGTWATIRYAIKSKKPVIIILPSGEVSQR